MAKDEKKVKVKIRPLRGIGGYGSSGDVVDMPIKEAERYQAEGYCDILSKEEQKPEVIQSELELPKTDKVKEE